MERHRREAAQKVKNYRTYHLSGDLSDRVAGQVAQGIRQFDSPIKTFYESPSPGGVAMQKTRSRTRPSLNYNASHPTPDPDIGTPGSRTSLLTHQTILCDNTYPHLIVLHDMSKHNTNNTHKEQTTTTRAIIQQTGSTDHVTFQHKGAMHCMQNTLAIT